MNRNENSRMQVGIQHLDLLETSWRCLLGHPYFQNRLTESTVMWKWTCHVSDYWLLMRGERLSLHDTFNSSFKADIYFEEQGRTGLYFGFCLVSVDRSLRGCRVIWAVSVFWCIFTEIWRQQLCGHIKPGLHRWHRSIFLRWDRLEGRLWYLQEPRVGCLPISAGKGSIIAGSRILTAYSISNEQSNNKPPQWAVI